MHWATRTRVRRSCIAERARTRRRWRDRKSTRLNSSHGYISYAVFCLQKKESPSLRGRRSARAAGFETRATSSLGFSQLGLCVLQQDAVRSVLVESTSRKNFEVGVELK